jgi:predicted nucleotidyltransferase
MSKQSPALDQIRAKLKAMLPLLRERYHVRTLELFGSYARGEENPESDLDLLVTFDEIPSLFQFVGLENLISDELGIKVDLVMKDSLKPNIARYILEEAQEI